MFECDACHVNDGLILQLLVHRPRAYIWIYIYIFDYYYFGQVVNLRYTNTVLRSLGFGGLVSNI